MPLGEKAYKNNNVFVSLLVCRKIRAQRNMDMPAKWCDAYKAA
jgi:hypothetical protein